MANLVLWLAEGDNAVSAVLVALWASRRRGRKRFRVVSEAVMRAKVFWGSLGGRDESESVCGSLGGRDESEDVLVVDSPSGARAGHLQPLNLRAAFAALLRWCLRSYLLWPS
jgi:hypothetical protein